MNRMEVFQEVYGKDYVFTETELSQLQQVAELIVRECAQISEDDITDGEACCTNTADRIARQIKQRFGVEK